ncbi:Gfo/Idh/MocA family oxidoreductase [Roseomonas stagni]|uniref:Gfo/Idh/MocA family oxidoreductase n=1 Tax=Falsiroseomonas algicola TaxID=2716930 RepID=A0A6M1LHJ6_9PROT|nr:Gfo/Idh/MocA family oxidoreductase [Falsiroseomonas algicola]NGM19750.1 Gfo/Idh/MocA family oxidoreductase [Falsiroseomonas algicola]
MVIEAGRDGAAGRRLRLGMVGGGQGAFIGAVHRIAARLDDRYELVAGALSSDPDRARASAADLHIAPDRAYADFEAMAEAEAARPDGIDVVAIVTPNHRHAGPVQAFARRGIHVICDKPLTHRLEDAEALAAMLARTDVIFGLTHNYTGYPLVRQAREMVAQGDLGALRVVQVEYPQDWLTTRLEETGQKQAAWRTDPERSGAAGCVGDIGTHAFNLAEFVTGLRCESLAAELTRFVPGRRLDDNAHMMLRFAGGARGMLWSSQVAPGNENGLKLRVYGEKGGLEWHQEQPNTLRHTPFGEPSRLISRSGPGSSAVAGHASRIPAGHPEGYLEGFAQLYRDLAEQISARIDGRAPDPASLLVPGIAEGLRGMRFIAAAVASSQRGAAWTDIPA